MSPSEELILCEIRNRKVMYMLNKHHMNYKYCKSLTDSGFLRYEKVDNLHAFYYNLIG